MEIITGGVTAAQGISRQQQQQQRSNTRAVQIWLWYTVKFHVWQAGTFTTNVVKAAPVKWDQDVVYNHPAAQAVICNSGIANACTGAEGYGYCKATADAAAEILDNPGRQCSGCIHRRYRDADSH